MYRGLKVLGYGDFQGLMILSHAKAQSKERQEVRRIIPFNHRSFFGLVNN